MDCWSALGQNNKSSLRRAQTPTDAVLCLSGVTSPSGCPLSPDRCETKQVASSSPTCLNQQIAHAWNLERDRRRGDSAVFCVFRLRFGLLKAEEETQISKGKTHVDGVGRNPKIMQTLSHPNWPTNSYRNLTPTNLLFYSFLELVQPTPPPHN